MTVLSIDQLHCRSAGRSLLHVEQLSINGGELLGVIGPNGAGKSTLLKAISGDCRFTGQLDFHGRPLAQWQSNMRARHLAVMPQASQLTFSLHAEEVVALGLTPLTLSRNAARQAINSVMQRTDCWQFRSRDYATLSGGERQRVQLARVLLQLSQAEQAPLLLLDEPTSAQDLGQQHRILQLASDLCHQQGYTVIAVIHDLNQTLRYCPRCCLLAEGKLLNDGPPQAVLTSATIARHWQYSPTRVDGPEGRVAIL